MSNVDEMEKERQDSLKEVKHRVVSTITMLKVVLTIYAAVQESFLLWTLNQKGNQGFANRVAEEGDNVHISLTKSVIIERLEEVSHSLSKSWFFYVVLLVNHS